MTKRQKFVQDAKRSKACNIVFAISFAVALALIIAGFILPPIGVIDGSVLTAVGELLTFPVLAIGFRAFMLGYDLKLSKGDTALEISNDEEE